MKNVYFSECFNSARRLTLRRLDARAISDPRSRAAKLHSAAPAAPAAPAGHGRGADLVRVAHV